MHTCRGGGRYFLVYLLFKKSRKKMKRYCSIYFNIVCIIWSVNVILSDMSDSQLCTLNQV